jgi:phenylacetate-coenzyme A ligase PaaK-like adenylate-forming protein
VGTKEIGALYLNYDMLNPAPGFNIAMRLEAQGIHCKGIFCYVPEFRWLMQKMEQEGKVLKRDYFPELKFVLQSGELSKSLCDYGCELFGVPVTDISAICEAIFGGVSCAYEWKEGDGARMYPHWPEATHFAEIFPPGSDEAVEGAEFGEFAVTSLDQEAMAYIRFRAEDLSYIRYDPCPYCGYTHMQIRIMSRVSESVNVKDRMITMGDVQDILYTHPESRPLPAQLIREEPQPQDKLRLRVCYNLTLSY